MTFQESAFPGLWAKVDHSGSRWRLLVPPSCGKMTSHLYSAVIILGYDKHRKNTHRESFGFILGGSRDTQGECKELGWKAFCKEEPGEAVTLGKCVSPLRPL